MNLRFSRLEEPSVSSPVRKGGVYVTKRKRVEVRRTATSCRSFGAPMVFVFLKSPPLRTGLLTDGSSSLKTDLTVPFLIAALLQQALVVALIFRFSQENP